MADLVRVAGPLAGKSFNNALIDSYEVGAQNWTPRMRQEFKKRRGYDLQPVAGKPRAVSVILHWEAIKKPSADYVVFVHLRDTSEHPYAQDDSEPRQAWYPTSWWAAGETVLDEHTLYLPAGTAPPLDLYVGVYTRSGDTRLPVFDANGNPVANNEVILQQNVNLP